MTPDTLARARHVVRVEATPRFQVLRARGFEIVEQAGLYPRVRAVRLAGWTLAIDFWMCLDEQGRYRTEWSRQVPFELGGAAAIDREERQECVRYWRTHVLYASRPFEVAVRTLEADVVAIAEVLESWSEEAILSTGERVATRRIRKK